MLSTHVVVAESLDFASKSVNKETAHCKWGFIVLVCQERLVLPAVNMGSVQAYRVLHGFGVVRHTVFKPGETDQQNFLLVLHRV